MEKSDDARDTLVADTVRAIPATHASGEDAPLVAGRYRILGLIGSGAMGTVYRARDSELDEVVALKVLHRELAARPGLIDRFRQEVRLARKVTHPHVARVFDIGEHGGDRFLTMELVDGESLADVLEREGAMPLARVAAIVRAIAAGLDAAHRAAIVHRDLKPENVLVARDGRVVITDFGIARALAGAAVRMTGGGFVGTPAYMAPEQVEGAKDVDARADVYALGEIAYELATGQHPWPGTEPLAVAFMRMAKPPPDARAQRAAIPIPFSEAIMRAMTRDRDRRTASAMQLADELDAALAHLSTTAKESAPPSMPALALAGAHGDLSLAVLPLAVDRGADANDAALLELANGMTAELVDALSMTSRLRVRPHGSTTAFADRLADAAAVGRELGVGAVVTGSLRRTPTGFRVSARVISASQGFQLWTQRFECEARGLLTVTDEIAHAIAAALSTTVPVAAREPASDGEAIALYLRSRAIMRTGWHVPDLFAPAVDLIEQARARAPHDPTILAGWAIIRARKAFLRPTGTVVSTDLALARDAAERVVASSPHIGEAWIALATVRWLSYDLGGLLRALRGALDASPSLARAQDLLGRLFLELDAIAPAMDRLDLALALDPSNIDPRWEVARAYALLGRWDDLEAIFSLPVEGRAGRAPHAMFGSRFAVWRGVRDPNWVWPASETDSDEPALLFQLFAGVIRRGIVDEAVVAELERLSAGVPRRETVIHQMRAEAFFATNDVERALDAVARSIDTGLHDLAWMDRLPLANAVRASDPRWSAMRARVAERVTPALAAARELGLLR